MADLRQTEEEMQTKSTHARLYPRHHSCKRFLPIAPRLSGSSGTAKDTPGTSSSARVSRSGSTSAASVSSFQTPVRGWQSSSRRTMVRGSVGKWPGSEGSGNEPCGSSYALLSTSSPIAGLSVSAGPSRAGSSQSISHSGPDTVILDPAMGGDIIDTIYSLIPSSSVTGASLVQNAPVITLLEGTNPFDFPLDLGQRHDNGTLEYLDDMDLTEGITAEVFHVEGWSNYMWSPETGFEQVNTGYLAVSQ
ncbi:hypothetical protein PENSUB_9106 [Penicillium subrubescens]|uniref:Uncharacterized protein n=1 Tax=Penicillium subrubescens TaxID=1316194 RepID=A0A1Q5TDY7_9EURO|nr:hypothetical protein PENSUB_9106 [Penicillium subrubescens]